MLSNLVSYSDSENEEEINANENQNGVEKQPKQSNSYPEEQKDRGIVSSESEEHGVRRKRRTSVTNSETVHKKVKKKSTLPLPSSIGKMFGGSKYENEDSVTKHQGRKRTFEHVEGNWASYIFIPLIETNNVLLLYEKVIKLLKTDDRINVKLHSFQLKDCHLTLSRTVSVRHYWMDSMYTLLKEKFDSHSKFFFSISGLEVYTNDDESRTFVSLKVDTSDSLLKAVTKVDQVFKEFNLPVYYTEPSFHISIAWFLGDHKKLLDQIIRENVEKLFLEFHGGLDANIAEKVCVKFGHKLQQIELK